ncbi:hypothetical protein ACKUFS_07205 [Pseudomonas cannabina]|nr:MULTISPECIES: hypothetical protein [Pseudomonas syringae group]KPB71639.1 Uncharacterized protein AC507_4322 [Pseudomonas syringae pv. maculicola]MBM0138463.1 hypothetical protein [Pseudomonas cannabina pv. alisalensis]QHE97548.1 hypothetical protein PMA4326_013665 [Pseudomonas syringae pv. maculicola str. ES4326]QQN24198.1 hypothetical protein JGS08_11620 [Pseudomonas cannabina pv. alisalensis]UBY98225.1 hypothetical protein LCG56_03505 [Pseudomonas cannabina pv. alisalensis]
MSECITHQTFGLGQTRVFILSPVMPVWDEGGFAQPLIEHFIKAGHQITVFDSLSLPVKPGEDFGEFARRWAQVLEPWGTPQLLVGVALGGALAQELAGGSYLSATPALLLLSSPAKADALLDSRLGLMADLAEAGQVDEAKRLLDDLVLPEGQKAVRSDQPVSEGNVSVAIQGLRLTVGFRLLAGLDISERLLHYKGRVLSVYGEKSQLVGAQHVPPVFTVNQCSVCVPNGGMRPLADDLPRVLEHIDRFLNVAAGTDR